MIKWAYIPQKNLLRILKILPSSGINSYIKIRKTAF